MTIYSNTRWKIGLTAIFLGLLAGALWYYPRNCEHKQSRPVPKTVIGEYLSWPEVNVLFPRYAKADVIDVDTGLTFRVQRRGGSRHADVQPLTAADTAIMKQAYGGKWSWKRRAAIVQLDDGRRIAASMAGMPHGQGAIEGNNFNGHFCLHFKDSQIHRNLKVDLAHQIMVWKAAGRWDEEFSELSPQQVIEVFFTALDQHETLLAAKLLAAEDEISILLPDLEAIETVKVEKIKKISDDKYTVETRTMFDDTNREVNNSLNIILVNNNGHWRIKANSLAEWLIRKKVAKIKVINDIPAFDEDWESDESPL